MGIGTPGGNKIPTILDEVIVDYLNGNGTLQESVDKPRFYNDGGTVYYENATSDEDINIFKSLGYGVQENVMTLTSVVFKVPCMIKIKISRRRFRCW